MCALKLKAIAENKSEVVGQDTSSNVLEVDDSNVDAKEIAQELPSAKINEKDLKPVRYLGVDIGNSTMKMVLLAQDKKKNVVLLAKDIYIASEEGIVDESELYAAATKRIKEFVGDCKNIRMCLGIPQFFGSVLVKDFPTAENDRILSMLVANETDTLSHLSENNYAFDWAKQEPTPHQKRPVAIAVCNEEIIKEFLQAYSGYGVKFDDLGMTGIACLNAVLSLNSKIKENSGVQLILDVGADSTTVIALKNSNIIFINTLSYGSSVFTNAINQKQGCSYEQAEFIKKSGRFTLENKYEMYFMRDAARCFGDDIKAMIDEWKTSNEEVEGFVEADFNLSNIWLCGRGVLLPQFPEFISSIFEVPTNLLKVNGSDDDIALLSAYGLALQLIDKTSDYRISFLPKEIKDVQNRKKEIVWLYGAFSFCAMIILLLFGLSTFTAYEEIELLKQKKMALEDVSQRVAAINIQRSAFIERDNRALPILLYGETAYRLLNTWNILADATYDNRKLIEGQTCWPIYWKMVLAKSTSAESKVGGNTPFVVDKENEQAEPKIRTGSLFGRNNKNDKKDEETKFLKQAASGLKTDAPLYMMLAYDRKSSDLDLEITILDTLRKEKFVSNQTDRLALSDNPLSAIYGHNEILRIYENLEAVWKRKQYKDAANIVVYPIKVDFNKRQFINQPARSSSSRNSMQERRR